MANIILRCFCAAFFLVSALSAFAAGKPLAPGDTFYKDIKGANVSKVSNTGATVGSTGIAKTQKVEIYVQHRTPKPPPPHSNAWNSGSVKTTFSARFGWNAAKVRQAVKFGLKVGKTNAYTIAGSLALGYLLDKTGWFVDDDTIYYEDIEDYNVNDVPEEYKVWVDNGGRKYDSPHSFFMFMKRGLCKNTDKCRLIPHFDLKPKRVCLSTPFGGGDCGDYVVLRGDCPVYLSPTGVCIPDNKVKRVPVTDSMIDDVDFEDYNPSDKDIPFITPYLGDPDETVITEQPEPIVLPTETTTTQNPDGSTTTTAKDTTVNVTINTTNSGDMYVTTTETTTTTTYQDGTQTSKTTDTKTIDHKDSTTKPDDNDDTNQDIKVELPEIPTDCDLVPTLCDTQKKIIDQDKNFYEWMREPFDSSNQPDLPTAKDRDYTRKYPINIGDGQCPAPMDLHTILAGTVSVSFDPFCQFASILRYLVLTGASIFAAYILLGVVRRG